MYFLTRRFIATITISLCFIVQGSPAQTITSLPVSQGISDPIAATVDRAGNLFVADQNDNSIRELLASDSYVTMRILVSSGSANFNHPSDIAIDANGNLFVADSGNHVVKEITAAGGYTVVSTLPGSTTGFVRPSGIAVDGSGNVYVADSATASVTRIDVASGYSAAVALAPGNFSIPTGLAIDGSGNVFVADYGSKTVKEIFAAGGYTNVISTREGDTNSDPFRVALDAKGNLFIADQGDQAIWETGPQDSYPTPAAPFSIYPLSIAVDANDNLFVVVSGSVLEIPSKGGYAARNTLFAAPFGAPSGVALDPVGNIFVADRGAGAIKEILASDGYATVKTLAPNSNAFTLPQAITIDKSNNIFVADIFKRTVSELVAPDYNTVIPLAESTGNFQNPNGIAVDGSGNVFVSDLFAVKEILADGGYQSVNTLGGTSSGLDFPQGIAIDTAGNLFVTDSGAGVMKELSPADNYSSVKTIPTSNGYFGSVNAIAVDRQGNIYVTDGLDASVEKIIASTGYQEVDYLMFRNANITSPEGITLDSSGNIYIADQADEAIKRVLSPSSPLVAATLPGSRSVAFGETATVFATIINAGQTPVQNCGVGLLNSVPSGLAMTYQATDAATNLPVGTANTPVALAPRASQSFLLSFQSLHEAISATIVPEFYCQDIVPAPTQTGIDTAQLRFSYTPVPDVIALAATTTGDGTVHATNGAGAFAVATVNAGAADRLAVTADTGGTTLPVALSICETTSNGQCLAPPSPSVAVDFAANASPTFSIFATTVGAIPFAPGNSRIFVRFKDSAGVSYGVTSVALTTN